MKSITKSITIHYVTAKDQNLRNQTSLELPRRVLRNRFCLQVSLSQRLLIISLFDNKNMMQNRHYV